MRVCFVLLSKNSEKNAANYAKISEKFVANNELIQPELADDIFSLRDQIVSSGSRFEKVIAIVMTEVLPRIEEVAAAVVDIAGALGPTQSITVCDEKDILVPYLSEPMINYTETLKYATIAKKTPTVIYNAVFGVDNKSASRSMVNEIKAAVRAEEQKAVAPAPVDMPMPVPVDDAEPMPVPVPAPVAEEPKKKKFGLPWKKSTRDKLKNVADGSADINEPEPMPIPEPVPMSAPVAEPMPVPTPQPTPVAVSEPTPIPEPQPMPIPAPVPESQPIPTPVSTPQPAPAPQEAPSFIDDSMFTTDMPAEPSPAYQNYQTPTTNDLSAAPVPQAAPAPAPVPEQTVSKKGFGRRKLNIPKMSKDGLSMQTRPRIIYVTGTGRIGQSTLAGSLGFTAAQYFCRSLIVDMDMIKRAISCIYPDYTNSNSQQSLGLVSAIRSPHLIDEIAQEHYDRVSTLGVSITAADNREIMKSITAIDVQSLLLQSLTKYNVVVVDMPWSYLMENPQLLAIPHDILFCTSNDVMTMLSDLSQLTEDAFARVEDFQMLIAKIKFVLNMTSPENMYDNKAITEKNFTKICYSLTEEEMFRTIPVLANIPFLPNIGNQVSVGRPASAYSKEFEAFCAQILHELK